MEEIPQIQIREKIGIGIGELSMSLICQLLFIDRPFRRVLNFQSRCDHKQFGKTVGIDGRQNHSSDPRVDRQVT